MPLYQVTWRDTLSVYRRAMKVDDPLPYILNEDAIRGAIARPYAEFAGVAPYPTLHEKAAALMHGVANAHGFADGNKRTAVLLTLVFIRASGYEMEPAARAILDDVVVDLVTGDRSQESVAFWLKIVVS